MEEIRNLEDLTIDELNELGYSDNYITRRWLDVNLINGECIDLYYKL